MLVTQFQNKGLFDDLFFYDNFKSVKNDVDYDLIESEDDYNIDLLLAGYDKENFKLDVDEDKLKFSAERFEDKTKNYKFKTSFYGKINKTFNLPKNILPDKINAKYENGILSITIPKDKELIKNKSITIR